VVQGSQISRSKSWSIHHCHFPFLICCHVWRLGPWNLLVTCNTISDNPGEETSFTGLSTVSIAFCLNYLYDVRTILQPIWTYDSLVPQDLVFFLKYLLFCLYSVLGCVTSDLCTETWRHNGDDVWWALCDFYDGPFFNLHGINIQRIFLCPI
jgi:hypothetical protein